MLSLGVVDAVLGWDVFEKWDPAHIETVFLAPDRVPRIGYIPAAVSAFSRHAEIAAAFVHFLAGPEGQAVLERHGYVTDLSRAGWQVRPGTPVGGVFDLPAAWR